MTWPVRSLNSARFLNGNEEWLGKLDVHKSSTMRSERSTFSRVSGVSLPSCSTLSWRRLLGNGNVQRDDDYAAVLDRPLQVAADLVEDIAEHANLLGEPLDGIVQGFTVAFARTLVWRHRMRMVPESERSHKNLAVGAARL